MDRLWNRRWMAILHSPISTQLHFRLLVENIIPPSLSAHSSTPPSESRPTELLDVSNPNYRKAYSGAALSKASVRSVALACNAEMRGEGIQGSRGRTF